MDHKLSFIRTAFLYVLVVLFCLAVVQVVVNFISSLLLPLLT